MHVLMYADRPAGLGGIETHLAELAAALARLGVQVTVAFSGFQRSGAFQGASARGVRLARLDKSELAAFALEAGVDILHAHSAGAADWGVRHARELGLKLVVTLHGPGQRLPSSPGRIDRLIAVSPETARPLLHLGGKVTVIENGIDLARFAPRGAARPKSRGGPLVAVYLGRVGPAKRPGLSALHKAIGVRRDVVIHYLSDWAPDGRAEATDDPAPVLQQADLVFSTGRGVREAMACGAAACVLGAYWDGIVTPSNFDRLRYYNFSGRATRRRPTEAEIAKAVHPLIRSPERLAALGSFGRESAERFWDVRRQAELTLRVYEEAAAPRGFAKIWQT